MFAVVGSDADLDCPLPGLDPIIARRVAQRRLSLDPKFSRTGIIEVTIAYLILPVLLVVSQVYMQQMMTPPSTDPQQQSMQSMMKFMPLMFGYFALVVPAGLTLYWFTSNILALLQQYFTKTQMQPDSSNAKKKSVISSSIPENTPLPANSTSTDGAAAISGEDRKSTNAKSKRKRRKR